MAGLALKLAPRERLLINGVVIENGPRRTQLLICSGNAAILRLREALDAEALVGPLSHAYFAAQQAVAGETDAAEAGARVLAHLAEAEIASQQEATAILATARLHVDAGEFYKVMRTIRPLVDAEIALSA